MSAPQGRHGFEPESIPVQLGGYIYEVLEQPLPLIEDELGEWFGTITEAGGDTDKLDLGTFVGEKAYALLQAFIPDLMPLHEFRGYASAEALEAGGRRDVEVARRAPTGKQVRKALDAGFRVNGIDIWNDVTRLVDPTVAQTVLGEGLLKLIGTLEGGSQKQSSAATAATGSRTSTDQQSRATDASGGSTIEGTASPSNPVADEASAASPSLVLAPS